MQKVKVKINSKIDQANEKNEIDIIEDGFWDNENQTLKYSQSESNKESILVVEEDKITLSQVDGLELIFQPNLRTESKIKTPQGEIEIFVETKTADFKKFDEASGEFELFYTIKQDDFEIGNYELKLQFAPVV